MLEIDRYALARAAELQAEILAHYEVYEFHPVVAKLQVYCSEDLGAFYLDVLKDRLYTTAPKSLARRSAQTALWQITQAMLRWMAPFLSFTAEEAWAFAGKSESIFVETYWKFDPPDAALLASWRRIREIRDVVNKEIEAVRATGAVGSSLQATVTHHRRRRRPRAAHTAGRRPALRVHHLGRVRGAGPGARGAGAAVAGGQVRTLLALARRRRPRSGAPRAVRALHQQPVRQRRAATDRLTPDSAGAQWVC